MYKIYPQFVGVDDGGDFVWELPDGRWTWGDDPYQASKMTRSYPPEEYVIKYGTPTPIMHEKDN